MNIKVPLPEDNRIIQEAWSKSPCSECKGSPCCSHLPLTAMELKSRKDFIDLALLCCYNNIQLALKNNGYWTLYYRQSCRFLDRTTSKCGIHGLKRQSLVCKSYNPHTCWYKPAFQNTANQEMIFFDLERLLAFDKYTGFFQKGYLAEEPLWSDLIQFFEQIPLSIPENRVSGKITSPVLEFRKCNPEEYLFFPPYERPGRDLHFELINFRLGFPGVYLAAADSHWVYLVQSEINRKLFHRLTSEYFPALKPEDGAFSFTALHKRLNISTAFGEQWVILEQDHIPKLRYFSEADECGNLTKKLAAEDLLSLPSQEI